MDAEVLKANLDGTFWTDDVAFRVPHAGTTRNALCIFGKNVAAITWSFLSVFERTRVTLGQTRAILGGATAGGLRIAELMQVKHFGDAGATLAGMLREGTFALDEGTACAIHAHAGKEEALTWGRFRNSGVWIGGVAYEPPDHARLPDIADRGFSFIRACLEPKLAAVATFLFMARSQFFHDANKRTASMMMNGVLMRNGFFPVTVPKRHAEEFDARLAAFYETGDATETMRFLDGCFSELYGDQPQDGAW